MIRSVAFNATGSISVSVQIPVAVDPLAEGEVADAFTAALLIKDADQLLKGPAFHVTEPLVGVADQLIDGRKLTAAGSGQASNLVRSAPRMPRRRALRGPREPSSNRLLRARKAVASHR